MGRGEISKEVHEKMEKRKKNEKKKKTETVVKRGNMPVRKEIVMHTLNNVLAELSKGARLLTDNCTKFLFF